MQPMQNVPAQNYVLEEDKLSKWWIYAIYASIFLGGVGHWLNVIVTSVMYYAWRKRYPNKARSINRHGWLAFLIGTGFWLALYLMRRFLKH